MGGGVGVLAVMVIQLLRAAASSCVASSCVYTRTVSSVFLYVFIVLYFPKMCLDFTAVNHLA